jgi:hypothetical protein
MPVAWRAETLQGQIAIGTEFGIIPEGWLLGEQPRLPPAGTRLIVHFSSGAPATVDLEIISDDESIIRTSDGTKWRMRRVGEKGLAYQSPVPSGAPATFWIVKERAHAPQKASGAGQN